MAGVAACGAGGGGDAAGGAASGSGGSGTNSTGSGGESGSTKSSGTGLGPASKCEVMAADLPVSGGAATTPSIVWSGEKYLVAFATDGKIAVSIVDKNGDLEAEKSVTTEAADSRLPSIQATDSGFLVLWADGSTVRGRTLDASGAPEGSVFTVSESANEEPRPMAASTAKGVVAATWMDSPNSVVGFVDEAGVDNEKQVPGLFPTIAAGDNAFAVSWSQGDEGPVQFATLDSLGSPLEIEGSKSLIKSMAYGDGDYFVSWEDMTTGSEQVKLAKISGKDVSSKVDVPYEGGNSNWPAVAWTGSAAAVAYYQFRDGPPSIFLALINADLDHEGGDLEVASGARFPSIAFDGAKLGIAYAVKDGPVRMALVQCE